MCAPTNRHMDASLFPPMALDSPPVLLLVSVPPTGLKAGTSPMAVMAAISLVWVFMCVLWLPLDVTLVLSHHVKQHFIPACLSAPHRLRARGSPHGMLLK